MEEPQEPPSPATDVPSKPARVPLPGWAKVLIVLAVLACLAPLGLIALGFAAAFFTPALVGELHEAQGAKLRADIVSLRVRVDAHAIENGGRYPASLEELLGPEVTPLDPWGAPYRYEPPGAGRDRPRVFTLGADGEPGGEGLDQDLDDAMIKDGR